VLTNVLNQEGAAAPRVVEVIQLKKVFKYFLMNICKVTTIIVYENLKTSTIVNDSNRLMRGDI
jgi:hypothetical protein